MQSREEMSNETMETGNGSDRKFCTGGGNAASDECTGKRAGDSHDTTDTRKRTDNTTVCSRRDK